MIATLSIVLWMIIGFSLASLLRIWLSVERPQRLAHRTRDEG